MPRRPYEFAELDRELFALLKQFGYEPAVIFDVGAARGYWSAHLAEIYPRAAFHLFEPLVDHVPDYSAEMTLNLACHSTFTLHKLALGERTGETAFNMFPNPYASTTVDVEVEGLRRVRVPIMTLEDAVQSRGLPVPNVLKMDVQGSELAILKGGQSLLPAIDVLLLECWLWRGYGPTTPLLSEITVWLGGAGFALWDIGDCYRDAEGVLGTIDCMFVNARTMARYLTHHVEVPESTATAARSSAASRSEKSRVTRSGGRAPISSAPATSARAWRAGSACSRGKSRP